MPPLTYPADVLRAAVEHLRGAYPREGCGVVVRRQGSLAFVPVENAVDRHHAADPRAFPRTSRDGFLLDPRSELDLLGAAGRGDLDLVAVVHSHCEAGPHFSAADEEGARLPDGEPVLPGVEHLVVSFRRGQDGALVVSARSYELLGRSTSGQAVDLEGLARTV